MGSYNCSQIHDLQISCTSIAGVCVHGVESSYCLRLESVQRCAARWACGSRWSSVQRQWSKSSDVCLQELHWPTLSSRQDILHGRYDSLKLSDYCRFNTSCTRAYSMTLVPPQSILIDFLFL